MRIGFFLYWISIINLIILLIFLLVHAIIFFGSDLLKFINLGHNRLILISLSILLISLFIIRLLFYFKFFNTSSNIVLSYIGKSAIVFFNARDLFSINYGFITVVSQTLISMLLILIVSLYYTVAFQRSEIYRFIIYSSILYVCGLLFIATTNIIIMFVAFEGILIPTSIVLDSFSKTLRARDATKMMIVLTQIGAILLFFSIFMVFGTNGLFSNNYYSQLVISRQSLNFLILIIFFGFGTKMPVWPFYSWLPEAHVEVSTNFSIVLSGISIKFAFLGYLRFIEILGLGDIYWIPAVFCFIGAVHAALKMDDEADIKKLVALQTVAEMQILIGFVSLEPTAFMDFILFVLPMHCWISTLGFILVDLIMKRYHTRNLEHLYGIFAESPRIVKFIFFIVFILGSVPGTGAYSVEFLIQMFSTTLVFNVAFFLILQFFIVIWSRNIWWILWGGDPLSHTIAQPFSFTRSELAFISMLILYLLPPILFIDVTGFIA